MKQHRRSSSNTKAIHNGLTRKAGGRPVGSPRPVVSAEAFVTLWQRADSVEAVAKKTGMSRASLHVKAYHLRKKGVPLKKFGRVGAGGSPRTVDYKALATLARRLERGLGTAAMRAIRT